MYIIEWFYVSFKSDLFFRHNWKDYLQEASRVLMYNGEMIISESIERYEKIKAEIGKVYNMKCIININSASYYINGKLYASATYKKGTVPSKGYFGFAVYRTENINVSNIKY